MSNDNNQSNAGVIILMVIGFVAYFQTEKGMLVLQDISNFFTLIGLIILSFAGLLISMGLFYYSYIAIEKGVKVTTNMISSIKKWKEKVDQFMEKHSMKHYNLKGNVSRTEHDINQLYQLLQKQSQQIAILEGIAGITDQKSVEQATKEIVEDFT